MSIASVNIPTVVENIIGAPKCEIIMVPFDYLFFRDPCKGIALISSLLYSGIISLLLSLFLSRVITLTTIAIAKLLVYLALIGDSDKFSSTLLFLRLKRSTTIAISIVERTITIWRAMKKRSHESLYKIN